MQPVEILTKRQKIDLWYCKGKTLAALNEYDKRAEECLTKCVKLKPTYLEAWICLGEVFYQKRDFR
jgi:cytochrome c-type biogenesis protein CcmH/NrfG